MRFDIEPKDLDIIADKVAERLFDRILPYLDKPKISITEKKLYSIREAAEVLSRGPWAIRHLIADKKIPVVRDGKRIFIEKGVIDSWVAERKVANL
jgi:excisionase family DNA binding protein